MHDFPDKQKSKVTPHGVYDMGKNPGWVSVGIDHDTAEFAVDSLRHWWLTGQSFLISRVGGGGRVAKRQPS